MDRVKAQSTGKRTSKTDVGGTPTDPFSPVSTSFHATDNITFLTEARN